MAKKKKKPEKSFSNPACQKMSLREENLGKSHVNISSMLKLEHLQNIATWASQEPMLPGLAALFGRQLASNAASSGVCLDRSLVFCQRCETALQPGDNCTIRIEKAAAKVRRSKRKTSPPQNNVIYTCHFCLHRNVRRGTSRGHLKGLSASRESSAAGASHVQSANSKSLNLEEEATMETEIKIHVNGRGNYSSMRSGGITEPISCSIVKRMTKTQIQAGDSPITPLDASLAKKDGKSETAKHGGNGAKQASSHTGGSGKRKRKGWSSLKDIVESNELAGKHSIPSLVIPFVM